VFAKTLIAFAETVNNNRRFSKKKTSGSVVFLLHKILVIKYFLT